MGLLYIFDLFGTLVFSSTGAIRGIEKKLDLFGIFVMSFLTAVGGGTIRDIIMNKTPFYFFDINYTVAIVLGMFIVIFFKNLILKYKNILVYLDAIGLGVFSVIGAEKGMSANLPDIGIIMVGLITGIGGGILRDVMIREIPFVLEKEIYATASIIGLIVFVLFVRLNIVPIVTAVWISILVIVVIRILSFQLKINLPKF